MHLPKPPIQKDEDRQKYHAYLASREWQLKRAAVIEREKGMCQGCRGEPIEHVHHLTYSHIYDELLFQLLGLCECCHRRAHFITYRPYATRSTASGWD